MESLPVNLPAEIVRVLSNEAVKDEEAEVSRVRSHVLESASSRDHGEVAPPQKRLRLRTKTTPQVVVRQDDDEVPKAKRFKKLAAAEHPSSLIGVGIAAIGLGILGLPLVTTKSESRSCRHTVEVNKDVDIDSSATSVGREVCASHASGLCAESVPSSVPNNTCSLECHVCGPPDLLLGCSSCGRICHVDCISLPCA